MNRFLKLATAAAAATLLLQACGTSTVSRDVYDSGRAAQVVFPDIETSAWLKDGTFPTLESLRLIAPGMDKDQLYQLIGRPHFDEGMIDVREWDYIFNFRTGTGYEYVTCQYKVLFDKDHTARYFFWQPAACVDRLAAKPAAAAPERIVERVVERVVDRSFAQQPRVIRMAGDLLFAFDRSGPGDLLPGGVRELVRVANELLTSPKNEHVEVVGYTDRLGSQGHNQRLSEARAETVRAFLVARGFEAGRVSASGRGMASPVVECPPTERQALVACLAPNRRVEFVITGGDARR